MAVSRSLDLKIFLSYSDFSKGMQQYHFLALASARFKSWHLLKISLIIRI